MAVRLDWSPTAKHDLRLIAAHIAEHNVTAAKEFVRNVFASVEMLQSFPNSGRVVPEFQDATLREIVRPPCRIIYRFSQTDERIEIARIWHGARGAPLLP